ESSAQALIRGVSEAVAGGGEGGFDQAGAAVLADGYTVDLGLAAGSALDAVGEHDAELRFVAVADVVEGGLGPVEALGGVGGGVAPEEVVGVGHSAVERRLDEQRLDGGEVAVRRGARHQ